MTLDIYNTHIELYPYKQDDYPALEDLYRATDKFTLKEYPCGYLIEDGKLFLPRGTSISKIEYMVGAKANHNFESDPKEKMSKEFSSLFEPRNKLQEEAIDFLMNDPNPQLALNAAPGTGKSFMVAFTSTQLSEKTIIISPNEGLKSQWIGTYHKMFNYKPKNLMNISGSNVMDSIILDEVEPADIYFVNHATLRNYINQHNGYALHKFFKKIKVGIKVYDESHLEFANILLIDFFSNTARTWYLTATFDRSDKTESVCFKRAFSSVETYGEYESKTSMEKHVVYHVVNINSRISPKERYKVIPYGRGMSSATYGQYAFNRDPNQTAYNTILTLMEKIKDLEGKILIFVPLIEAVDDIVRKLKIDCPERTVAGYHSKISKDEKESAIKKDTIVSTIKSCGVGRDIPGLRSIICIEPHSSRVVAEQMIGRLRPYSEDKLTYFFDIVDISIAPVTWWWKARHKKIQELVKETIYLNLDE